MGRGWEGIGGIGVWASVVLTHSMKQQPVHIFQTKEFLCLNALISGCADAKTNRIGATMKNVTKTGLIIMLRAMGTGSEVRWISYCFHIIKKYITYSGNSIKQSTGDKIRSHMCYNIKWNSFNLRYHLIGNTS